MKRFVLLICMLLIAASVAASPRYQITDLGSIYGPNVETAANAIAESGMVAGSTYNGIGDSHAAVWGEAMTDLGVLGGYFSGASGVNRFGQAVGWTNTESSATRAFSWQNDLMQELDVLPTGYESKAYGINDSGQIVGYSNSMSGSLNAWRRAVMWQGNTITDLGALDGGIDSEAYAINESGQIVGWSSDGSIYNKPVLWDSTGVHQLGLLGTQGGAFAINNLGYAAGWSYAVHDLSHAVLWRGGEVVDMGTLGGTTSYAYGINDSTQAVGWSFTESSTKHAFIWQDGAMLDLNDLIAADSPWELRTAYDVNNSGQIVGIASYDGHDHAFLLTPVPEPAGISALLAGVAICGRSCFRRRRAAPHLRR